MLLLAGSSTPPSSRVSVICTLAGNGEARQATRQLEQQQSTHCNYPRHSIAFTPYRCLHTSHASQFHAQTPPAYRPITVTASPAIAYCVQAHQRGTTCIEGEAGRTGEQALCSTPIAFTPALEQLCRSHTALRHVVWKRRPRCSQRSPRTIREKARRCRSKGAFASWLRVYIC